MPIYQKKMSATQNTDCGEQLFFDFKPNKWYRVLEVHNNFQMTCIFHPFINIYSIRMTG